MKSETDFIIFYFINAFYCQIVKLFDFTDNLAI